MPLFSLPIDESAEHSSPRNKVLSRTSKKRKRRSSPNVDLSDGETQAQSDLVPGSSSLVAASTNPLSLTPSEISQYKLAGLELDKELPSQDIPDFPHRGFPSPFSAASQIDSAAQTDGEETGTDIEGPKRDPKGPHLRMQHLSVLTTVLHRCLLEGDIPRASRAWAMLLRTQIDGKSINIRNSGYWGIGAELLVRSNEQRPLRRKMERDVHSSQTSESGTEISENEDDQKPPGSQDLPADAEKQWGTPFSLEKVKDYYERLILQYPYKRQFHTSVNSLDFWPAMLSCEIYGIQVQHKASLHNLTSATEDLDSSLPSDTSKEEEVEEEERMSAGDPDAYFAWQQRRDGRRRERWREILWRKRDEVRLAALLAAGKVAARMDELMAAPPYSDSAALHRLRGMVALYVGDLGVPEVFGGDEDDEDEGKGDGDAEEDEDGEIQERSGVRMRGNRWLSREEMTERRLLERRRRGERERGELKKEEERERARRSFERVAKEGGVVGGAVDGLN